MKPCFACAIFFDSSGTRKRIENSLSTYTLLICKSKFTRRAKDYVLRRHDAQSSSVVSKIPIPAALATNGPTYVNTLFSVSDSGSLEG
jgi:hypothetical protein